MYLAYSLLLSFGFLVLIPYFLYQAIAHGKYLDGLRQRFGSLDVLNTSARPVIWLHCVSVGETQAARPLVARLRTQFPEYLLVVSTITATGQALAQNVFSNQADAIIYFPFDWTWTVRRALTAVRPDVVLIMETELWPNFLRECNSRAIPVALVNGRISNQSFRRYRIIRFFLSRVLSHLTMVVMQSDIDAQRISALGIDQDKLFTAGNLKFDVESNAGTAETTQALQKRFAIRPESPLFLAASTHAPEEKIIVESFQQLRKQENLRLMIAPRRPERFQEVASLLDGTGLRWGRKTNAVHADDTTVEVILLDTIGELPSVYELAFAVFIGGSIVERGGHNVLEPAAAGTCVITGHHTDNFQAIVELLTEAGAIIQLPPLKPERAAHYLTRTLAELLRDDNRRIDLGTRAKQIVENNKGTADRTINLIRPLFKHAKITSAGSETLLATNSSSS